MIILITIISFLLGFIINFIALPYILEYVVKDAWRYVRNISTLSVFRWSVSIIVSFALSALIIRNQQERIIKQTSSNYQHIVDSLNFEIKILQQYKVNDMNFDFSDYTYSGLIGIFSAIIGMCYPLMLQAIGRIDEKYHVIRFVELFKEEVVYGRFNHLLLLSIAFAVIDPFALYIMSGILWMQMLVLVGHTLLVLVLLLHVVALYRLILIYDDPHLFYKHLIKKNGNFVLELIDLAKYAANREDVSLYNACIQRVYEILLKVDDEKE